MPDEKLSGLDLDFGPAATPAGDDPLAALAADLATQIEADVSRKRERETARQVELLRERGPQLEVETPNAAALEVELLASTLDLAPHDEVTVTRRVIRTELRPRSALLRTIDRIGTPVGRLLSLGPDPERLRRVVLGLSARAATLVALTGVIVAIVAGAPGSAYDRTYAPDAALVRHGGGLAPLLAVSGTGEVVAGIGSLDTVTATGLLAKARNALERFDAAVVSGATEALAAAFSSPEAAAPWVLAAERLHAAGLTRRYLAVNPLLDVGAWEPLGDRAARHCWGAPILIADFDAQGGEVDRRRLRLLCALFVYRGAVWELDELSLRP